MNAVSLVCFKCRVRIQFYLTIFTMGVSIFLGYFMNLYFCPLTFSNVLRPQAVACTGHPPPGHLDFRAFLLQKCWFVKSFTSL